MHLGDHLLKQIFLLNSKLVDIKHTKIFLVAHEEFERLIPLCEEQFSCFGEFLHVLKKEAHPNYRHIKKAFRRQFKGVRSHRKKVFMKEFDELYKYLVSVYAGYVKVYGLIRAQISALKTNNTSAFFAAYKKEKDLLSYIDTHAPRSLSGLYYQINSFRKEDDLSVLPEYSKVSLQAFSATMAFVSLSEIVVKEEFTPLLNFFAEN